MSFALQGLFAPAATFAPLASQASAFADLRARAPRPSREAFEARRDAFKAGAPARPVFGRRAALSI